MVKNCPTEEKLDLWVFANHPAVHRVGELEVRGSVAVAVGISDMWLGTGDVQHGTHDMCYLKRDALHAATLIVS